MFSYETTVKIDGSVKRLSRHLVDKGLVRSRALDSLIISRVHGMLARPENLLYSSADGQRPSLSTLFERSLHVNSLVDFLSTTVKEACASSCIVAFVDETPGHSEVTRAALETSLIKVKPYDLSYFENLLEIQEKIYSASEKVSGVFMDSLQRLIPVQSEAEPKVQRKSEFKDNPGQKFLLIEGIIQQGTDFQKKNQSQSLLLRGQDSKVSDFRTGLNGVRDFFLNWDEWLGERARHPSSFDNIFVYSHVKGLLPSCWEELRARGVSAENVRLPQWASYSNAISAYMEFLLANAERAGFLYLSIDGRCHFAEWSRSP